MSVHLPVPSCSIVLSSSSINFMHASVLSGLILVALYKALEIVLRTAEALTQSRNNKKYNLRRQKRSWIAARHGFEP